MGAGKTTIGRLLAHKLKLEFVDSDQEIEERTGANIPWIFDVEGEEGFRDREQRVIAELTQRAGILLATGGGAILRPENRLALAGRGIVIYLYTSLEQQIERTGRDRNRPLLQGVDPAETLRNLMAVRDPLYREIADYVIETDGLTARHVAQSISVELLEQ
jgi:shikimate kinase